MEVKEILKEEIKVDQFLIRMMKEIVKPKLDEFVADTSNPYDDILVAALYPILEKEIEEKIKEVWDKI